MKSHAHTMDMENEIIITRMNDCEINMRNGCMTIMRISSFFYWAIKPQKTSANAMGLGLDDGSPTTLGRV